MLSELNGFTSVNKMCVTVKYSLD